MDNNRHKTTKSNKDFGKTLSNLSKSIDNSKFSIINNIRDSKVVKIKAITKKTKKPEYNRQEKIKPYYDFKENIDKKEKEKEISNDSSSDYVNEEEDDFDNILRESLSVQSLNIQNNKKEYPFSKIEKGKIKNEENQKNNINDDNKSDKILYDKINEHFEKIDFIDKYPYKEKKEEKKKISEDLKYKNPYQETDKSYNIDKLISKEKEDISKIYEIKNIDKEKYEEIKSKNIFEKNTENIMFLIPGEVNPEPEPNKLFENNEETKIRLINHNKTIENKLKEIKFFERLKSISDSRFSFFEENYQKDNNFLNESSFENILINEKNLNILSPLTLIFQKIFNPSSNIGELNFFQKIFNNEGYQAYFNESELENIPKFFTDLNYVNNLFNTFDIDELNNFLEEIKTWKNTFTFEQEYIHPIKYFKEKKVINLKKILTVYFISPYDLIIDCNSRSSGIAFSDTVMALNQFKFHCDIKFDNKKGRFRFKTNIKILNSIKMVKNSWIKNTIKEEGKNENDIEIIDNVWIPMKKEILEQDVINQQIMEKIYQKYLNNNLNKYNSVLEDENRDIKIVDNDSDDAWDSFSQKSDEEKNKEDIDTQINNNNMNDLDERNITILKSGGIFLIAIYLIKVCFSSFSLDTIFGIFWIALIGYLIYKFR